MEFALTLALFLITLLGTAEFGIAVFRYNMVADLAQEGARRAAVCGKNRALTATDCNIAAYVGARALGMPVTVTAPDATTLGGLLSGDPVQVQVRHDFSQLTRLVPLAPTLTLSATAQMVVSR